MKIAVVTLFLLVFIPIYSICQSDSIDYSGRRYSNKYVFHWVPSPARNIYGIAAGLGGSESICYVPYERKTHGINLQIFGTGIFQTIGFKHYKYSYLNPNGDSLGFDSTIKPDAVHNGLIVSPFGTMTNRINGVSISALSSAGTHINGLAINGLWNSYFQANGVLIGFINHAGKMNGVQIGLVNKTHYLNGVQIGLWNKKGKRSFPLMNIGLGRSAH